MGSVQQKALRAILLLPLTLCLTACPPDYDTMIENDTGKDLYLIIETTGGHSTYGTLKDGASLAAGFHKGHDRILIQKKEIDENPCVLNMDAYRNALAIQKGGFLSKTYYIFSLSDSVCSYATPKGVATHSAANPQKN